MKLKIVLLLLLLGIIISVTAVSAFELESANTADDDCDDDDLSWDVFENYTPSARDIAYEIHHNPVGPFNLYRPPC